MESATPNPTQAWSRLRVLMMFPPPSESTVGNETKMQYAKTVQLLPRKEGRFRLPRKEGGSGLQDPCHLGQGDPTTRYAPSIDSGDISRKHLTDCLDRQLRRRPRSIPTQPPSSDFRCHRPRHALPFKHLNQRFREPGCTVFFCFAFVNVMKGEA